MDEKTKTPKPAKSNGQPPAGPRAAVIVLAVLAVAAVAFAGYMWDKSNLQTGDANARVESLQQTMQTQRQTQDNLQENLARLTSRLQTFEGNLHSATMQLQEVERRLTQENAKLRDELQTQVAAMDSLRDSLVVLRGELRGDAMPELQSVERLLLIANEQLYLADDVDSAAAALRLAAAQLQTISDPSLQPVQDALRKEIAALDAVQPPDVTGVVQQLAALSRDLDAVALATAAVQPTAPAETADAAGAAATDSVWLDAGKAVFADLAALVQVQTDVSPPATLLNAEWRPLLVEKVRLILESAQVALLRGQGDVFAARMQTAKDAVLANFAADSTQGAEWLMRLDALAATPVQTPPPDITASLQFLRANLDEN